MRAYLDNAATTPVAPEVMEVMSTVMKEHFGNPSSAHFYGRNAKALIENARRSVARHLNCSPAEIVFMSGGTEADNMAIHAAVFALRVERIITSKIEHHAVGHTVEVLRDNGDVHVEYVNVLSNGHVDLDHLESLLKENKKTLVTLMHANNEISTLLPLQIVSAMCKKYSAYFHSDTVQTMGHYPFNLESLEIDFLTCAAHKFHGPKGVGFLYVNRKTKTEAFIHGGAQERGLRGGTENLYGIVGLSKAMDLAYEHLEDHRQHVQSLKDFMMVSLKKLFSDAYFHGDTDPSKSLYTVLNVSLPATEKSGMLLFTLDLKGVAVSGGSACSSGATKGSHVLVGIGADMSRPNVRFSFSRYTTKEEVQFAIEQLASIYHRNL
jgi:cysteine desulfurase